VRPGRRSCKSPVEEAGVGWHDCAVAVAAIESRLVVSLASRLRRRSDLLLHCFADEDRLRCPSSAAYSCP
jgi:hypothetical protein